MVMDEGKPLGFIWGNVYIGICLIFVIASIAALLLSRNVLQTTNNPIALWIIIGMYVATAFGLWKRKTWGLYLASFTLLLWFAKGIVFILMGQPSMRMQAGVLCLIFAVLYGIYFFRRREFFEW